MKRNDLVSLSWEDYELLDSGENKKLERFGKIKLIRPETQALWPIANPGIWKEIDGEFVSGEGKGFWQNNSIPENWNFSWSKVKSTLSATSFKHIGVFPEQAINWQWISERTSALKNPSILNLFGYTGFASITAALAGGRVTHVDASKQSNTWAKENATLSNVPDGGIRYITDDAIKFAERDIRRGVIYDGIILDPPAFGRGPKGEVWHIEEHLPRLLRALQKLQSRKIGSFFILNGYASGYSPLSFRQSAEEFMNLNDGEYGELNIQESNGKRSIPSGVYVRALF